ncbi:hypothetical protein [Streptomyces sp. MB09-02B]|uniref:hypothetical protein n=1 Tax=Streptomyces sp. MB09-02B TaxID=3028667 RepID=UPI0029BB33D6|nr:hypothetical protein [Streptomyces sp. MB09-02B]MDX3640901.1 hypothetical protein [Streptomyces sp. MB09-02B]
MTRAGESGGGTERGEDAFVASADRFAEVAAELAAPKAAVLTHAQLEELLGADARGRPAAAPCHLALRAGEEERVAEVVDAAGVERTRIERGRRRRLATVFGKVTVTRIAYRGTGVEDLHPADAALNLPSGMHAHGLARSRPRATASPRRASGSTPSPAPESGTARSRNSSSPPRPTSTPSTTPSYRPPAPTPRR